EVGDQIFDHFGSLTRRPIHCRFASVASHTSWRWAGWCLARCITLKVVHISLSIVALLLPDRVANSAKMKAPRAWQYEQAAAVPRGYVPS
ncbi:hypothetical protein HAX54_006174, partial [Datura stramonium]|nr:hypothetical protein [Datura stramonium]